MLSHLQHLLASSSTALRSSQKYGCEVSSNSRNSSNNKGNKTWEYYVTVTCDLTASVNNSKMDLTAGMLILLSAVR
ncbi:hypothetical protein ACF0H5_001161 [Mactra antiquata]